MRHRRKILRTFIFEMELCEEDGKLSEETTQERYQCFVEGFLENPDYRKEIYVGISCRWYHIWDRGTYRWCQWVTSKPCSSYEELKRYYNMNGVLLCVSYLLGSEDMHYENLIAHGEYPIIVDLEMAIGSRGARDRAGLTETERFYQESVLQTGILPLYAWNRNGEGVNVGAMNGKGGQLIPIVMPVVVNPGTVKCILNTGVHRWRKERIWQH